MRLAYDGNANSHKIVNLTDPTSAQDAATKAYVDALAAGLEPKPAVVAVADANITLSGAQTIDAVSITAGQRVLAIGQSTPSQNGIWVAASGAWIRPTDFASSSIAAKGSYCLADSGTNYKGHGFILTGDTAVTVDTTAQTWQEFSGAADIAVTAPVQKSGNTISLGTVGLTNGGFGGTTAAAAKTNLGFMGRYAADIGDGSSPTITVTHNLGTLDVIWQLYKKSDGMDEEPVVTRVDTNTISVAFGTAPASNSYRIVVMG